MRSFTGVVTRTLVIAVALGVMSGCEDEVARNKTSKIESQIAELSTQIRDLQTAQAATNKNLEALQQRLTNRINERMTEIKDGIAKVQIDLQQTITDTNSKTSQTLLGTLKSVREDTENRFKSVVAVDMAQQVQTIRNEIEKVRGELIGYMDLQLKELYPYAFQPRRMDSTQPPKAPQE